MRIGQRQNRCSHYFSQDSRTAGHTTRQTTNKIRMEERDYYHKLFRQVAGNLMWFLAGLAVCGLITVGIHRYSLEEETRDTVTVVKVKVDTLFREKPVPVKEYLIRYARVARVNDSLKTEHETDDVLSYSGNSNATEGTSAEPTFTIPISQKEYKDSTYHAWVSGYMASLDSIEVYQKNILTTQTITEWRKPPRLSFGITGGYGYGLGSGSFEPFVGIGVSYRLWPRR